MNTKSDSRVQKRTAMRTAISNDKQKKKRLKTAKVILSQRNVEKRSTKDESKASSKAKSANLIVDDATGYRP